MNIKKYPQYELYRFTKLLYYNKDKLIPSGCDKRCVYSTIINRCYYSSYTYASEWLYQKFDFEPISPWELKYVQRKKGEHKQVRDELKFHNMNISSNSLFILSKLRKKADYKLFMPISDEDLDEAVVLMNNLFTELKF